MAKYKILIATHPFTQTGKKPLELLEATGWELKFNPFGRRLRLNDIEEIISDLDAIIAGTEPYPVYILLKSNVNGISRVGIGLNNIPLMECKEYGISIS